MAARQLPSTAVTKRSKVQSDPAPDITGVDQESVVNMKGRRATGRKMSGKDVKPRKQPVPAKKKPAMKDFANFSSLFNKNSPR